MDLGASIPKLPREIQRMRHLSRQWKHPATAIGGTGLCVLSYSRHFRLIPEINYHTGKVFLRHILTHAEYSKEGWKE
jgi:hypothetical protein